MLRMQGISIGAGSGSVTAGDGRDPQKPTQPRGTRRRPEPLEIHEPPTYIRIVWEESESVDFYPEQRRYIRIETDANGSYHNPSNPTLSRINIIATQDLLSSLGSTPLEGGRLRAVLEAKSGVALGASGAIRVELTRPGLPTLSDERQVVIVSTPPARSTERRITLPPFRCEPVEGMDDIRWAELDWPDDTKAIASSAQMDSGTLVVYYSTVFPKYAEQRALFERRDPAQANSFTNRYEVWLAVHSLLMHKDQQDAANQASVHQRSEDEDTEQAREREERCRIATMAALIATREIQNTREVSEAE